MAEMQTVTGIILPNDWDAQGRLTEVVLYGADESEFVLHGGQTRKLFGLCHHRVRCTGKRVMDNRGRWLLDVEEYTVLGDDMDCGYQPEGDCGLDVGLSFPRMWRN